MQKILPFLLFFTIIFVQADTATPSSIERVRSKLTFYYHKLLCNIDNSMENDKNCTLPKYRKIKKNSLHLITSVKSTHKKFLSLSFNIRGHIDLPKLSKKIRITFSKQSLDELTNRQIDRKNENIINDDKFRIGIKYQLSRKKEMEFFTKFSIKVHHPFGPFQQLGVKKLFLFPKQDFSIYTRAGIYYYYVQSYFVRSIELNFIKPLTDQYLISQANDWDGNIDNHHEKRLTNHLKLHHHINSKNHFVYWISYGSVAKHKSHYEQEWQAVSISYIHHLNKWFYIQTIPRIIQRKEDHYRNDFEISVNFGMSLGM